MRKRRFLAWLMTMVMAIGLMPATALADDTPGSVNPPAVENLKPTFVDITDTAKLNKTAVDNKDGTYSVTLSVKANQPIKSEAVEIVLVLDSSGSMNLCTESDFESHQHSDKNCNKGSLICTKEEHEHDWKCYNWKWELVCGKTAHRHSNSCYQWGCGKEEHYHENGNWCSKTNAELADSRMDIVQARAVEMVQNIIEKQANVKIGIVDFDDSVQGSNCIGLTDATKGNQDTLIGKINGMEASGGTDYKDGLDKAYSYLDNNSGAKKVVIFLTDGENNDKSFTAENKTVKDLKAIADIYTIGFTTSNTLLENIATTKDYYSTANNSDVLAKIFNDIVNKLIALVTDPIGKYVTLQGDVTATVGSESADSGLKDPPDPTKIEWNRTEGLASGETLTLTYTVALKDASAFEPGTHPVYLNGDGAKLNYTANGTSGSANFPQPYTTVEVGRLDVGVQLGDAPVTETTGSNQILKVGNTVKVENYNWSAPEATKTVGGTTYYYQYSKYDNGDQFDGKTTTTHAAAAGIHKVVHYYTATPEYTVAYEWDGAVPSGCVKPTGGTYKVGESVTVKSVTVPDGYTFDGWYDGQKVGTTFTMPGRDVTLTGTWTKNPVDFAVTKALDKVNGETPTATTAPKVKENDVLTYKVTLTANQSYTGSVDVNDAKITAASIQSVKVNNESLSSDKYTVEAGKLTLNNVTLAEGAVIVITYTYKVTANDATVGKVENAVFVTGNVQPDNPKVDVPVNNSELISTKSRVTSAAVGVHWDGGNKPSFDERDNLVLPRGESITLLYEVNVTNKKLSGDGVVKTFTVSDQGTTYVGYATDDDSITVAKTAADTVNVSGLDAGKYVKVYFTKVVTVAGTIKNTAVVDGNNVPSTDVNVEDLGNDLFIYKTRITDANKSTVPEQFRNYSGVDYTVADASNPIQVADKGSVTLLYKVTVKNEVAQQTFSPRNATATGKDYTVTDHATLIGYEGTLYTNTKVENGVTTVTGTLKNGQSVDLYFTKTFTSAEVEAAQDGMLKNVANLTVDAQNKTAEETTPAVVTVKVDFMLNYKDNPSEDLYKTKTIIKGTTVTAPDAPTRDGYLFGGWYRENTTENTYNFAEQVNKDTILYAKWLPGSELQVEKDRIGNESDPRISGVDVTGITFGAVEIPEDESVTLLYAVTVTNKVKDGVTADPNLTLSYEVSDFGAVLVKGNAEGKEEGVLAQGDSVTLLYKKTFNSDEVGEDKDGNPCVTNTVEVKTGETTVTDEEVVPVTPVDTELDVEKTRVTTEDGEQPEIDVLPAEVKRAIAGKDIVWKKGTVVIPYEDSVTLLYKVTVTNKASVQTFVLRGANDYNGKDFEVVDKGAVFVGSNGTVTVTPDGENTVTGTLKKGQSVDLYFTKTFVAKNVKEGKVTNTAKLDGTDKEASVETSAVVNVTVKFNLNYAGAVKGDAYKDQTFAQGDQADEPVAPTRTNYTFVGWFEANSSTAFDFDTEEVNEDKTLYAHWQLNPPTAEQLGDIALEVICDQHANKDCDAVYPSLTEATEYSKTGFIIGEVEGKTVKVTLKGADLFIPSEHFADKDKKNITELTFEYDDDTKKWSPVSDTHLVAVIKGTPPIFVPGFAIYVTAEKEIVPAEKVNINYDPGEAGAGEAGKMPFDQVAKGEKYKIDPCLYEYEGYKFVGWESKPVLDTEGNEIISAKKYADEGTIPKVETSLTLVAQWKPIDVKIKFDPNASSLLVSGEMDDQTVQYGVKDTLNENQFARIDGYAFVGWNTQPDGEGTSYTDKDSITVSNVEGITLYAQWEYASVVLTYNANGGKGFMWPETYSKGTDVTVKDCAFTAPAGQEFACWNTKADGTGTSTDGTVISYVAGDKFVLDAATILYAQWKPIGAHGDLKVTYHANGGTGDDVTDPPTGGYAFDTTVTVKSNPFTAPDEMKFVGWSESPIGEAMVHPGDMFILNKNTDLYAIWKYLEITPPDENELTGSRKEALTAEEVTDMDLWFDGPGLVVPENGKIVMSAEDLEDLGRFKIAYKIIVEGDPKTAFQVTEDENVEWIAKNDWVGIDLKVDEDDERVVSGRLDETGEAVLYCVKTFDEDDVKDRVVENTATIINESNPNQNSFVVKEKTEIKTEGVTVTKTLNSDGPFKDGDDVEFTITVTNLGNEDVKNIIVVEEPGRGLRLGYFDGVEDGVDATSDEPVLLDESGEDEFTTEEKSTDEEIVDNDNEGEATDNGSDNDEAADNGSDNDEAADNGSDNDEAADNGSDNDEAADNGSDNDEVADNDSDEEEVAGPEEQPAEVPASDIIAAAEDDTEKASEASSDKKMPYLDKDGNVVIPVLYAGQSIELTYFAKVTDRDNDHSNTVIVKDKEGHELDSDTNDDVKITSIDIDKEINENDTHPKRGGSVNYTITVTNDGEVTLTNINVYEYPGKVFSKGEFVGFSSDAKNVSVDFNGDEAVIYCLNPGESVTLTYKAKVDVDASKNEELKNYVKAEATTNEGTVKDDDTEDKGSVYVPSGGGIPSKDRPTKPSKVEEVLNTEDHFQYVQGYPDNTVGPERNITRAEATVIFFRLLNDSVRAEYLDAENAFPDVNMNDWFNLGVSTMENGGFVSGYDDGLFRPNANITRAELATIISNFDDLEPAAENKFADVEGHWAEKYINSAAEKGWLSGYEDGLFRPNQYITRAETMSMINRVLDRRVDADGLHAAAKQWKDNPESKWYYYAVLEATNYHEYERADVSDYENWTAIKAEKIWEN